MKRYKGIYFDNAATSYPKPKEVTHALLHTIKSEGGNPGRSAHPPSLLGAERLASARERIALHFGMRDERGVVFTKNATEAINLALAVFTHKGGQVLCDDMAHNALARPLYALEEAGRIRLSFFSAKEPAEEIAKKIEQDTVLLCATHASNICSWRADAEMLGALCRKHNIRFVLDASQSAGHTAFCLDTLGADAVCLPAHKGLYGIMGAGAVLFPSVRDDLPAFLSGGSGAFSRERKMPQALPEHFEAGTLPLPAIAAFEAGVAFVDRIGIGQIAHHITRLETRIAEGLSVIEGIRLSYEGVGGGIVSFTHKTLSPAHLAEQLAEAGVAVRAGLHCAPLAHQALGTSLTGTVRVSLGYTNTQAECEKFLRCIQKII